MPALEDIKVPVKIKLAALWASTMFCYVYGDYFELYIPGKLQTMLQGHMEPLGAVTQTVLLGTSVLMIIPSIMIFLSLALKPVVSRWLNIVVGLLFTVLMLLIAVSSGWAFYVLFAVVEVVLTSLVVWYAWRWPRQATGAASGI
ncbi:DUF6326 family protein [Gallaecimonas kandeliae]|uniref:DUF6326 family protein n=1 Tax=Gallaecimonas kandeliae TaxID=3029055 RepID=UPI0026495111|nr:DUF6326 family protein [Gallaecimonas kandeliae]WKE66990.1 DUF6326 family protein [Gallaecimonas kandeliae]